MMMQQQYPGMQAGTYARQPYNAAYYNMARPADAYQQSQQAAYANQQYQAPSYNTNAYYQPQFAMNNAVYQRPLRGFDAPAYDANRGRGAYFGPRGRGGFTRDGFRGGRGGFRGRRKRPFVGGSLATQREWEHQTACCFFLQGKCKFGDACRFLHKNDSSLSCQFGENCRVHGTKQQGEAAKAEKATPATTENGAAKQEQATKQAEVKQSETAKPEMKEAEAAKPESPQGTEPKSGSEKAEA